MIKLASWNVNSLKVRLEQVLEWMETSNIDILALQETKTTDDEFPRQRIQDHGYHVAFSGQKTYNGVAFISRWPLQDVVTDAPLLQDPQRRILAATFGDLRVINLYVPNGAQIDSEKYQYKLEWLSKVTDFIQSQLHDYPQLAVVGDFNIAPDDRDVYDPSAYQNNILVSSQERDAFNQLLACGLRDSFRDGHQEHQHFTWWDYRAASFRRNMGFRIDHILLSEPLNQHCKASYIDVGPRKAERPSDHAPLWVHLNIDIKTQDTVEANR